MAATRFTTDTDAPHAAWKVTHRLADAAAVNIELTLFKLFQNISKDTSWAQVERELKANNDIRAVDAVDLAGFEESVTARVWPKLFDVFVRAGQATIRMAVTNASRLSKAAEPAKDYVASMSFTTTNPYASEWAKVNSSRLITVISQETREAIQDVVHAGFEKGRPPAVIAREIRGMIGLNRPQAAALQRKVERWYADGLTRAQVDKKREFEYKKALRYRAMMIARTETLGSSNAGQVAAWQSSVSHGLIDKSLVATWITTPDDDRCPLCLALDGKQTKIGSPFPDTQVINPPLHPMCRCAVGLALPSGQTLNRDWPSQLEQEEPEPTPIRTADGILDKMREAEKAWQTKSGLLNARYQQLRQEHTDNYRKMNRTDLKSPEYTQVKEQYKRTSEETMSVQREIETHNNRLRLDLHEAMFASEAGTFFYVYKGGTALYSKNFKAQAEEAATFIGKITGKWAAESTKRITVNEIATNRAYANSKQGIVNLNARNTTGTFVHEMGHVIESTNYRDVFQKAVKFLTQRTKGEVARPLNEITGKKFYDSHEIAKKDKFIEPYMGKIYPSSSRATELISYGLELMFDDPLRLLKHDPEYLKFLLRTLQKVD